MHASVRSRLLRLAAPVIGLNLLGVVGLLVDTAMCSRLPEKALALEALSFASQLVFLSTVLMMGLTVGAVALVSRAHGAEEDGRVGDLFVQSAQLTVLLAIAIAFLGNLGAFPALRALGAGPAVAEMATAYLRPLFAGAVFHYLLLLCGAVLRGVRETMLPFVVGIGWNALNVVFNYAFIFGAFGAPRLGVTGAAVSTVISQAIGVTVLFALLARGRVRGIAFETRLQRIDRLLSSQLVRLGGPAALDMVILNVSFISFVYLLGLIDGEAVAAHGVGLRVQNVLFVPALGLAQVAGALVGNALGGERPEESRAILRQSVLVSSLMMSALGLFLFGFAGPLVEWAFAIGDEGRLYEYAVTWIRILGASMPIVGVHVALVGILRGAGATGTSLRINLVGTCLVQIPVSVLLGFAAGLGALGVWLALPITYAAKMTLAIGAFRRGAWARVGVHA